MQTPLPLSREALITSIQIISFVAPPSTIFGASTILATTADCRDKEQRRSSFKTRVFLVLGQKNNLLFICTKIPHISILSNTKLLLYSKYCKIVALFKVFT